MLIRSKQQEQEQQQQAAAWSYMSRYARYVLKRSQQFSCNFDEVSAYTLAI
jgi:hypothetical protein